MNRSISSVSAPPSDRRRRGLLGGSDAPQRSLGGEFCQLPAHVNRARGRLGWIGGLKGDLIKQTVNPATKPVHVAASRDPLHLHHANLTVLFLAHNKRVHACTQIVNPMECHWKPYEVILGTFKKLLTQCKCLLITWSKVQILAGPLL
jgi:hypothetical protein